jgi:hypothetical protein
MSRIGRGISPRCRAISVPVSQGDQGSVTGTPGRQVSAPNSRNRPASQADSASSILVTRSDDEGPGQGGDPRSGPWSFQGRS